MAVFLSFGEHLLPFLLDKVATNLGKVLLKLSIEKTHTCFYFIIANALIINGKVNYIITNSYKLKIIQEGALIINNYIKNIQDLKNQYIDKNNIICVRNS